MEEEYQKIIEDLNVALVSAHGDEANNIKILIAEAQGGLSLCK